MIENDDQGKQNNNNTSEKERRQKSAGQAFMWLGQQAQGSGVAWLVNTEIKECVLDLLDEYLRLSQKERKQIEAGKKAGKKGAKYGKFGGRPSKSKMK